MARSKLKLLAIIWFAPILSSCFQLNETIEIRPDASARLVLELGINSTLYQFSKLGEDEDVFCEPHERGPEDYPDGSNITSSTVELRARDDDTFCVASYEIRDIRTFDAASLEEDGTFGGTQGFDDGSTLQIKDEGGGILMITQSFSSDLGDPTRAGLDGQLDAGDELGESLISTMFAGKNITIQLRAPKVIESNGDISDDGTEVKWQLPVAELADQESKFDKEFRAQVKYELTWWERLLQ